jgi:HK97 family phage major capsid protein
MSQKTLHRAGDYVKQLTETLKEKSAAIEEMTHAWDVDEKSGQVTLTDDQHKAYTDATAEAQGIKAMIDAQQVNAGIKAWLDQPADGDGSTAAQDAAAAARRAATKSLFDRMVDSDEWAQYKSGGFRQNQFSFSADDADMHLASEQRGQKDVFSAMAGDITGQAFGTWQQLDIVTRIPQPRHVRELFTVIPTSASVIWGIRQSGFVNRAATVAERRAADGTSAPTGDDTDVYGLKPRSDLKFTTQMYPLATIAHIMYAHNTVLDDEPRLRNIINQEMSEGVKDAEDLQILYGDGTDTNIRGITQTQGIQSYTQTAGEHRASALRRAITRVQLARLSATGVVLNPLDWEDIELEEDNQGRYLLVQSVAQGAEQTVWRLPVIPSDVMLEGRFLLGAFGTGAKIYDRQQVNVQVSTENRDMFERNTLTFRGEERIAVSMDRPEAFVYGRFASE